MRGYSTKYALTVGIDEVGVTTPESGGPYVYDNSGCRQQYVIGKTFFEDRAAAEANARAQAILKIKSLKRQIAKLKPLTKKAKWRDG